MIVPVLFSLVILLTLISVGKLMSIGELINRVRNKPSYEIEENENNWNALLCLFMLFFGYAIYFYFHVEYVEGGKLLPDSASLHGESIDTLQNVSFIIISIAYMLVQPVLWFFAFRYRYRKGNQAYHYAHNNKLEMVWTVVPAIIFCGLIFYGLKIWNDTLGSKIEGEPLTVELYAKQFDWTARYAGADKELGEANYTMISDLNSLGLITPETIEAQFNTLSEKRNEVLNQINNFPLPEELAELDIQLIRYNHQLQMVNDFRKKNEETKFVKAYDDIVIAPGGEIHLPVNKPVELKMRSQDVIHSAYLPHFRVHMYCVPGMTTSFSFIPTITTAEMKQKMNNPEFDFLLYCNNICGSAHFNMQMKIVIETEEEFERWNKTQVRFAESLQGDKKEEEKPAEEEKTENPVAKL
jgi:cytochrome c oxidase subunit 2